MNFEDSTVLHASRDYFMVHNDLRVMYYSKSADNVLYGNRQIHDVLGYCSIGITYKRLECILTEEYTLNRSDVKILITKLLEVGLLYNEQYNYANKAYNIGTINNKPIENVVGNVPIPTTAYLHLTYACNFNCLYCYNNITRNSSIGNILSAKKWSTIINELNNFGIRKIVITGGEPFLAKHLFNIFNAWRDMGNNIDIITNGTLVEECDLSIIKNVFNSVSISIDSHIKEIANSLRGIAVYSTVHNTINMFNNNGIKWKINSVLTSKNINTFSDTEKYYLDKGAESVKPTIVSLGSSKNRDLLPQLYEIENYYIKKCESIRQGIKEGSITDRLNIWFGCGAGVREFAIDPFGFVYPCRLLMSKEWRCGQLGVKHFKDIWENSELLVSLRDYLQDPNKCTECLIARHCRGGCLAHSTSKPFSYAVSSSDYFCNVNKFVIPRYMELNCFLEETQKISST